MAATSSIPAVNAKNVALANDKAADVKKLETEVAAETVTAAINPSHPASALLSSRIAQISTQLKSHE